MVVMWVYRGPWMIFIHLRLAMTSPPCCIVHVVPPLWECCVQNLPLVDQTWKQQSQMRAWIAALSCRCVHSQIERFAILEYSQLESDSGEAYNLHCYLWQDSKAAMRGDPRTLWGLSSSIWPRLDQHMVGWRCFDHTHTCTHSLSHTHTN